MSLQPGSTQTDLTLTEEESINVDELYKRKRQRNSGTIPPPQWTEKKSFAAFAQELLADEKMKQRMTDAKSAALSSGLPLLRVALGWNTTNRIRAISYDLFHGSFQFRSSWSKATLILKFLGHIQACFPAFPENVALSIADVGLVHIGNDNLKLGEVVLFCQNGKSSSGEACVLASEELSGWVVRNRELVAINNIAASSVYLGRLVEKQKSMTILHDK
jgi:hypothetical protein